MKVVNENKILAFLVSFKDLNNQLPRVKSAFQSLDYRPKV